MGLVPVIVQVKDMSNQQHRPFVSVKFDSVGRVHRFLLREVEFKPPLQSGDYVVVTRGKYREYGTITNSIPQLETHIIQASSKKNEVVRRANKRDIEDRLKQQHRERESYRVGLIKIKELDLDMKLVRVEQPFNVQKLVFYFTADGRVDFRQLVKDLAEKFRCRIEMRQIGVRDEAKLLGGYGTCGRPLCCTTWLTEFHPISIKMAKQQNLSLNPSRLSGLCGRLKCCLRYELPNAAGEQFAGCANESSCSRSSSGGGCGGSCGTGGGCSSGNCSNCG